MDVRVGYRFHPTDCEIASHYLPHKNRGAESLVTSIREIPLFDHDPWELPRLSAVQGNNLASFFFVTITRRSTRATRSGYWRYTGKQRNIRAGVGSAEVIGIKRSFAYYFGRHPRGKKTKWVMSEYESFKVPHGQRTYVLCKVKNYSDETMFSSSCHGGEQSFLPPSDSQDPATIDRSLQANQTQNNSVVDESDAPGGKQEDEVSSWESSSGLGHNHGLQHWKNDISNQRQEGPNGPEMMSGQDIVDSTLLVSDEYSCERTALPSERTVEANFCGHRLQNPLVEVCAQNMSHRDEEIKAAEQGFRPSEKDQRMVNQFRSPGSCGKAFGFTPANEISHESLPQSLCLCDRFKNASYVSSARQVDAYCY